MEDDWLHLLKEAASDSGNDVPITPCASDDWKAPVSCAKASESFAYDRWMSQLPMQLRRVPVSRLLLPGTHDSAAHKVDFERPLAAGGHKWACFGGRYLPVVRNGVSEWTVCQDFSIADQLSRRGIRFLDFRVSWLGSESAVYLTHTFCCMSLRQAAEEIADFVRRRPGECVVVAMKRDWEHRRSFGPKQWEVAHATLQDVLGPWLCTHAAERHMHHESMSLEALRERGERVLVLAEHTGEQGQGRWKGFATSLWAPSADVATKDRVTDQKMDRVKLGEPNRYFILPSTLTPEATHIKAAARQRMFTRRKNRPCLRSFSGPMGHRQRLEALMQRYGDKMKAVSTITVDFPDHHFAPCLVYHMHRLHDLEPPKALQYDVVTTMFAPKVDA